MHSSVHAIEAGGCQSHGMDNVSAENSGRKWSARFHGWILQGLELTAALVHCNAATGFILAARGGEGCRERKCHQNPHRRESRRIYLRMGIGAAVPRLPMSSVLY